VGSENLRNAKITCPRGHKPVRLQFKYLNYILLCPHLLKERRSKRYCRKDLGITGIGGNKKQEK
jgi:hypothetical protein